MKYTSEITINLPRKRVIELYDSKENLYKWQSELQSFEHKSGKKGEVGAQSELHYKMGKRDVQMIETITKNNLPEEFHGTYDAGNVFNIQRNFFQEINENQTKWISESEFQFKGIGKLIFPLMKGSFKKQSYKFLESFKKFAEGEA